MSHELSGSDSEGRQVELVPARMINEVLYCERLCYLEWEQAEFSDNVYTVEGRFAHRRSETPRGSLPAPTVDDADESAGGGDERSYEARSVWLSSERLGITAKIDIVQGEGQTALPIEYKRGSRPDVAAGAWPPERAQLCAQVLLLREHGYTCPHGEIYYAADRQRVPIAIDEELVEMTLGAAARARDLVDAGKLPPPLEDSPKCVGCSLATICLPDEVALLGRDAPSTDGGSVRRLFPARADALPVYVQSHGARVGKKGDRLEVRDRAGEALADVPFLKISNLSVFANATLSAAVIRELARRSIPICHYSSGGYFYAITHGMGSRNVELRLCQFEVARDPDRALESARQFIEGKVRNQRTMLRRNSREPQEEALRSLKRSASRSRKAGSTSTLLGVEGNAAKIYFQAFHSMIADGMRDVTGTFAFTTRNRRPPRDPVNALLSFVYALLVKDLTTTLLTVGFDPYLGFYHTPHHGRPSLALDLAEEFRPLIGDSVVLSLINNGEVHKGSFLRRTGACALTPAGRKSVLRAYERRMDTLVTHPVFGYRISYRRVLEVQARLLGRALFGEIRAYPSFQTR